MTLFSYQRFRVSALLAASTVSMLCSAAAVASVADLDVSFCVDGVSTVKKLEIPVESVPYARDTCVRYVNLGASPVSVSIGFADGLTLADGRPGCVDESEDLGHFAAIASYAQGEASSERLSFVLEPGQSTERTLRLALDTMPAEPVLGCLITGPASVSTGTGINVVVRRANIVRLVPDGYTDAATGAVSTGVAPPSSAPVVVPSSVVESDAATIRQEAPRSVELFADARTGSVPLWLAACLFALAFAAGILASLLLRRR